MKIRTLKIHNFRQFHGEHEIDFCSTSSKNVVVIHGANGSGKTSILNAFKWAFYGKVDFDTNDENIVNDIALHDSGANAATSVKIALSFEHEGDIYHVERQQPFVNASGTPKSAGPSEVTVRRIGEDNLSVVEQNPEAALNFILPLNLQPYFFFNGERIEKLSFSSRAQDIKEAIKNIMGLTIVERAIDHLGKGVRRELSKDTSELQSADLINVAKSIDAKEQEMDQRREAIDSHDKSVREISAQIQDLNSKLKGIEKASSLQEERESLEALLRKNKENRDSQSKRQRDLISARGFIPLSMPAFSNALDKLSEAKRQGQLPAKVRAQLVDDLIAAQKCICERSVSPGSPEHSALLHLKNDLSDQSMENAFFDLSSDAKHVHSATEDFFSLLSDIRGISEGLASERTALNSKLDKISQELSNIDIDDVARAENKRKELQGILDFNKEQIAVRKHELSDLEKQLFDLQAKQKNLQEQEGRQFVSQQRLNSASKVRDRLSAFLEFRTNEVREKLSEKVNSTFGMIIRKPYNAVISDDFTLEVYKPLPNGGSALVLEKSTGENQICSLSFIASIVSDAKEKHAQGSKNFYRGGIFPIVMDSPFGALDPEYRELVARYIPKLADQVIILVSESQWRGEVQRECADRVAASYRLSSLENEHKMPYTAITRES